MAKKRIGEGGDSEVIRVDPTVNRVSIKSPGFVSIYANDVQVQTTPWDVRLLLGEITNLPTSELPTFEVNQLGELRLSPQLAKRLIMVMAEQLNAYEERFGEIPRASS